MKQLAVQSTLGWGPKEDRWEGFASTSGPVPESFPLVLDAPPFAVP